MLLPRGSGGHYNIVTVGEYRHYNTVNTVTSLGADNFPHVRLQ